MTRSPVSFDPMEARRHKISWYALPQELIIENIDPLMRVIVAEINASGWVWTAESCQGHPDAIEPTGWDHNTSPYLRLVVHTDDLGELLKCLADATRGMVIDLHTVERGPWLEVLVYVKAINTIQRNTGLVALQRFAGLVSGSYHYQRPTLVDAPNPPRNILVARLRALAERLVIDERFRVNIASGVVTELQALFRASADAIEGNGE
jgi:hypothetical protein